MYRSLLSCTALASALLTNAQTQVHQIVVLSEGRYDYTNSVQPIPVTLGSYDPVLGSYAEVATIPYARFGNDVKVENEVIYVSADSFLLKYDANTYALLDQEVVHGIRRIALWNDQILVTRGEFGGLSHYFEVRDKNSFDLLYTLDPADGIIYSCEAVEVLDGKAYVSMNNGFDYPNYTNFVGVVDLASQTFETPIDLGPDGYNPEHLMAWEGSIYAFNNKDYTGSSISRIDPASSALLSTINVAFTSGCGTSTAAEGKIYYLEYSVNQLARFDLANELVLDTLNNGLSAYGVLDDPINGIMYVSTTDFTSTGTLYTASYDGVIMGNVGIGVSAGKMALDVRTNTGLVEVEAEGISLYPNPAVEEVFFHLPTVAKVNVDLVDATGRSVRSIAASSGATQRIYIADLAPGCYTLRAAGFAPARFTKR